MLAAARVAPATDSIQAMPLDEVASMDELHAALARAEKAERERDEAQLAIASATDLVNTWCRETSIEEATRPADCKAAIERLWMHFGSVTAALAALRKGIDEASVAWLWTDRIFATRAEAEAATGHRPSEDIERVRLVEDEDVDDGAD